MKNGRILERGTHNALMERQGEYFELMSFDATDKARAEEEGEETQKTDEKREKDVDDKGNVA